MEEINESGAALKEAKEQSGKAQIRQRAKRLAKKTAQDWTARDVGTYASSIAFFFFMSMIPLLIIILQMLPLFGLSQIEVIKFLNTLIPEEMQGFSTMIVTQALKYNRETLSLSALVLVWAASKGTMALRQGLNRVYDVDETRPYPVQVLLAIGYTAALMVLFALMLFVVFVGPVSTYLAAVLPELFSNPVTIEMHDQILISLIMLVIFVMVYTFIPSGNRSFLRQIPGALLDAVVWSVFSKLFSFYIRGKNAYSMFYGSLGGIAILLFWLYCCFYIVLIGAFFNRFCGERWDRLKMALTGSRKEEA